MSPEYKWLVVDQGKNSINDKNNIRRIFSVKISME